MGLFDRMEGKLERAVNGVFAKAFRSEVQPVEIASAIRRAMDDRAASRRLAARSLVPNVFTIELSETDYERLTDHGVELENELIAAAEEHADSQHYQPGGPIDILFDEDADLETGVFRIRPSTAKRPRATGTTGQHQPVRRSLAYDDETTTTTRMPASHPPLPPRRPPPHPVPSPARRRDAGRPRHEPADDDLGETAAYRPAKPPASEAAHQPGRPAVARRRRRALPAHGRDHRPRPRRQRRHHPRRPRESPVGTARFA